MYNSILKTFLYVAEEGSFNKAASILYISSVAVKKQMDQLEEQIGVTLFHKTHAGTTLTDAGKDLYIFAKKYIEESDKEIFYLKDKYSSNILNINIANPLIEDNSIKNIIFSRIDNKKYNVNIEPYIFSKLKEESIINILDKNYDFLITTNLSFENKKIEFLPLTKIKSSCIISKKNKLSKKKSLKLNDLKNKNIYLWKEGIYKFSDNIRTDLINHNLNVNIYDRDSVNINKILLNFDTQKDIIITDESWSQFSSKFIIIPLENHLINTGLYYLKKNSNKFKSFISELKQESN